MKKQIVIAMLVVCGLLLMTSIAGADDGKFWGKGYFNYNHDFSKDKGTGSGQTNGFEFTRIYFGYDKNLDDMFSIRFLMDVNYDVNAWRPYMKNAYLAMNCKLVEGAKWNFGMVPMPFQSVNEKHWGYRSVATMGMDNYGTFAGGMPTGAPAAYYMPWGSTADLGIRWEAMFNDMVGIEFGLANGSGYKKVEGDMFKLIELRPTVYLLDEKALVLSAFFSYNTINDSSNAMVLSFMGGYTHEYFKVGAEYSMRTISKVYVAGSPASVEDLTSNVISAWLNVMPNEKWTVLARYDMYDPNTKNDANIMGSDKDGASLMIFGVDFHPVDFVHFIPNVQIWTPQMDDIVGTSIDESASMNNLFLTLEYKW